MSDAPLRIKRFYEVATVEPIDNVYVVTLDGRQAKTKSNQLLAASTQSLAQVIVDEWNAQQKFIDRQSMPLTAMLSVAIDSGDSGRVEWLQDVLNYLGSDLICYRADAPQGLAERQSRAWDPYLDFMKSEFDVGFVITSGIMAVSQTEASIEAVRRVLDGQSVQTLFALRTATAITGSAILALALWKNPREASAIFEASRIDEKFQEESWGVDDEARLREENISKEFLTVAQFLSLI